MKPHEDGHYCLDYNPHHGNKKVNRTDPSKIPPSRIFRLHEDGHKHVHHDLHDLHDLHDHHDDEDKKGRERRQSEVVAGQ